MNTILIVISVSFFVAVMIYAVWGSSQMFCHGHRMDRNKVYDGYVYTCRRCEHRFFRKY